MTVAELIAALQEMPQDLPVGYVNTCADEGVYWVGDLRPEVQTGTGDALSQFPDGLPRGRVVVLS